MQAGSDIRKARIMGGQRRQQRETENDCSSAIITHRDTGVYVLLIGNVFICEMYLNLQLNIFR